MAELDWLNFNVNRYDKEVKLGKENTDAKASLQKFDDVFELVHSLDNENIPSDYTLTQYETFLSSVRLGLIEIYLIEYFILFSNRKGTSFADIYGIRGRHFGYNFSIEDFFGSRRLSGHDYFKDAELGTDDDIKATQRQNMKTWLKIATLILESQMHRHKVSVLSNCPFNLK